MIINRTWNFKKTKHFQGKTEGWGGGGLYSMIYGTFQLIALNSLILSIQYLDKKNTIEYRIIEVTINNINGMK